MEGEGYHNGFCEDFLNDPLRDFNLDLQHVLLGDFNLCGEFNCSDNQLKSVLFDEDEGFNEDYDDDAGQLAITAGQSSSRRCNLNVAADPLITMTTAPVSNVASTSQAGSHDQCLPDGYVDDCYDNSLWASNSPLQFISTKDHMMSSPVDDVEQLFRQSSPQTIQSQETFYSEKSLTLHNKLPSPEELISMPFYKFKRLLENPLLSKDEKLRAKAVRKKGKNKSAARHCRQRKMAKLEGLEQEISVLQQQRTLLLKQKAQLFAETKHWETRCAGSL